MTLPTPTHLYESARAPNPRRVRIFMAEKGLMLPRTEIDIMAGEHFAAPYRDRTGTHHVPSLELSDGTILTETVAICRYLEALHPEPNLMGADAREVAEVEMWNRRVEFQLLAPIAFLIRHGVPAMGALESPQVPEWAEANRPKVMDGMAWLDARLAASEWVAGTRFSIADISAVVGLDFLRVVKLGIPETCPALAAWVERVRARPSHKA